MLLLCEAAGKRRVDRFNGPLAGTNLIPRVSPHSLPALIVSVSSFFRISALERPWLLVKHFTAERDSALRRLS